MIMTAVATVSLAAPSAALAHNGEHHRAGERHHHRGHHRHAHVLAFHAQAQAPASSTGSTSSPSPTTPASEDKAGTIASFTGGVLTIMLNDGSTVSGKVTERTEIECPVPSAGAADFSGHDGSDDNGFDDRRNDGSSESGRTEDQRGDCPGHDDNGHDAAEHCTSAALVPGASVKEAFLSVSSDGATWVKVEL
jgi:hypothetical protein